MLAAVMPPHNDFHALAAYLVNGKTGKGSPDRVAWSFTQNLPTDDPLKAATYMQATAALSRRCKNAAYHTIISWHENEAPSPELMQEIARRTLDLAGLAEHQALVMGHGDTPHRHLHMAINRVHPATGKAWSTSHDFKRFHSIMRQLSEEYGFQYVPSHTFDPDATADLPKKPTKRATYAAKRGANTGRLQWSRNRARRLAAHLSENLDQAATFDDIVVALAAEGLAVERKGKGLVAGNRSSYVKFSALGLTAGAKATGKHRAPKRRPATKRKAPARSIFDVDAVDIARAIGSKADVRAAVDQSKALHRLRIGRLPLIALLMAELREKLKASTAHKPHRPNFRPRSKPKPKPSKQLRSR